MKEKENNIPDANPQNNQEANNAPPVESVVPEQPPVTDQVVSPNSLSPVMNAPVQSSDYQEPKKKRKLLPIFLVIILLISLGLGGFFFYRVLNSPEKMILNSLNHLQNNVLTTDFNFSLPEMKESLQTGTISLDLTPPGEPSIDAIFEQLNALALEFEIEAREDMLYLDLGLTHHDDALINLELKAKNNMIYFFMESLFNEVLAIDFNTDVLFEESITVEDLEYLYEFILERFIRDMDASAFTQTNTNLRLDGNDRRVRKTNITLDNESLVPLLNRMLNSIRADERASEVLKALFEEVEDFDLAALEVTNEMFTRDVVIKYNVYTTGFLNNNVVGIDFIIDLAEDEFEDAINVAIEYRAETNDTINLRVQNELIGRLTIERGNRELTIRLFMGRTNNIATLIFSNPNNQTLNSALEISFEGINVELYFDMSVETVTAASEYNLVFVAGYAVGFMGEAIEGELTSRINIKDISNTPREDRLDTSNARNMEDLTLRDLETLERNFQTLSETLVAKILGNLAGLPEMDLDMRCLEVTECEIADCATGSMMRCIYGDETIIECPCALLDLLEDV